MASKSYRDRHLTVRLSDFGVPEYPNHATTEPL